MARYTGPTSRICRRLGECVCSRKRCSAGKRGYPPGEHGQKRARKPSDYGLQLREKQKVKAMYGLLERQFRKTFGAASRAGGVTGVKLLELLERRLDNVIYRLGFAVTRRQARQWVGHGHVRVNGRKVDVPSFSVRPDHSIRLTGKDAFLKQLREIREATAERPVPKWLRREEDAFGGQVVGIPQRDDVQFPIEEHLIVELYSK